jgi:protein-S-isoprenylcysteine O-methyltransferase Ste14
VAREAHDRGQRPPVVLERRAFIRWLTNAPLPEPHLLGIAAGVWLNRTRPWLLPGSRLTHCLAGCPLIAAGATVIVRSVAAADQVKLNRPDSLVTVGPYAVIRNPMYVGWALLHLGVGLAGGSAWRALFPPRQPVDVWASARARR